MLSQEDIVAIFDPLKVILLKTHVVYTSGHHGESYVNKDAIYPHTQELSRLCFEMARRFDEAGGEADIVAGPTVGGVILSQWVAYFLSQLTGRDVLSLFSEEDADKNRLFKRGYDALLPGQRVLLVEDVITTGGSIAKVGAAVKKNGGKVVGISALVNRSGGKVQTIDGLAVRALLNIDLKSYTEKECPLCEKGVAINADVGKGREYLARKQ